MKTILHILIFSFIGTFSLEAQVAKKVVVEHFTNTKCPICKNRNPGFYTNLSNHPDILHLSVHPSSPYSTCLLSQQNQPDNDERTKYYGVYGSTPRLVIQGTPIPSNMDYSSPSLFAPYLNMTTPIQINIFQTKYGTDSLHAKIIIKAVTNNNLGSLKLFAALAEDTVFYTSPNGEKEHYDVYRESLFGSTGTTVSIPSTAGDSLVYEATSASNPIWDFSRIYVLAILQNATTKEVIQSYASDPNENGIITSNKEIEELAVKIYPNPTRSILNIELENNNPFIATLFTMDGKKLLSKSFKGNSYIDVNHLSKGTYLLEIQCKESKTIKKIQIE